MYICMYAYIHVYMYVCMYVCNTYILCVCTVSTTGLFGQHPYSVNAVTTSRLVKLARVCDC